MDETIMNATKSFDKFLKKEGLTLLTKDCKVVKPEPLVEDDWVEQEAEYCIDMLEKCKLIIPQDEEVTFSMNITEKLAFCLDWNSEKNNHKLNNGNNRWRQIRKVR